MAGTAVNITDYTAIPGELADDAWVFPTVEGRSKGGKKTYWRVSVRLEADGRPAKIRPTYFENRAMPPNISGVIKVDSWVDGGVVKKAAPTIVSVGKNIGKKSQTNVFCQALRDALGMYNKQLRKADTAGDMYPPMLAKLYADVRDKKGLITDQFYVQRKYNGVRCMVYLRAGEPVAYSRTRKVYPGCSFKEELRVPLQKAGATLYIDGEAYSHDMPLQDISGAMRSEAPTGALLQYVIYDCFDPARPDLIYSDRYDILREIFETYGGAFKACQLAPTLYIERDQVDAYYKQFLDEGYEGLMVRLDKRYVPSYNSYHCDFLLKMKATLDKEFTIVGWEVGQKGKARGALMIVCEVATTDGGVATFPVTPAMELDRRKELAAEMPREFEKNYKGRPLIVYFDEYSTLGIPQRARTNMEIRTWE